MNILDNIINKKISGKEIEKLNLNNYSFYVFLLQSNSKSNEINESINEVFDIDYTYVVNRELLMIVNNLDLSKELLNFINTELMYPVKIGYSNKIINILNLIKGYEQAYDALNLVYIFGEKKLLYKYSSNNIDELIKSFNDNQKKLLLKSYDIDKLSDEDIFTINMFINCDLNIARASRDLYLHRNTLIYRLDKIQKTLNLDIRNFDDAMLLRIILLLKNY
ncbi:MAG: hypothetical protein GX675_01045 [Erysipelotrichaceae bacterium]|nr:hypothetical protein [Erysipelotrichaceae bacterium]